MKGERKRELGSDFGDVRHSIYHYFSQSNTKSLRPEGSVKFRSAIVTRFRYAD